MLTLDDAASMTGSTLASADASAIGDVVDVYIDAATKRPKWAVVRVGPHGWRRCVPLLQAQWTSGSARVPYLVDQVKNAPDVDGDGGLSSDQEAQLYTHYGLNYAHNRSTTASPASGSSSIQAAAPTQITD